MRKIISFLTILSLAISLFALVGCDELSPVGAGEIDMDLVGIWFWDESIYWTYVFNEDGTGIAGWHFEEYKIKWGVVDDILRVERLGIIPKYTFRISTWRFSIEDDWLHLLCPSDYLSSYLHGF